MFHKFKSALKKRVAHYLTSQLGNKKTLLFQPPASIANENYEDSFTSSDGRSIPVLRDHRYSMKKSWAIFGPMAALKELDELGLIDESTKRFMNHAKGHRTLMEPLPAIREALSPWLEKHKNLFISTRIPDMGKRFLKPSASDVKSKIDAKAAEHKVLLDKIATLVAAPPLPGEKAMEIGYTSGGESIIAFEQLGLKPVGIDNFYDDSMESAGRHDYIAKLTGTKTEFILGDITTRTDIEDDSLAFVYSSSVLEHISNLPAAFKEMYRILRPGGVMFHRYDPYFHIRGGHNPCTLDSPWGHVRLDDADIKRYIRKYRPHEADVTLPWIESALNRTHSQTRVQQMLVDGGFNVCLWESIPVPSPRLNLLTRDIVSECLSLNKGLSLDDLSSGGILVIAEKPAS